MNTPLLSLPAPCSPTNVSAVVDCSPHSAFVNWTSSNGAVFYIATAQHANGRVHSCKSPSIQTNCIIEGLDCGQNYISTVVAANLECNSTITEQVAFTTGRTKRVVDKLMHYMDYGLHHILQQQ